MNKIKITVEGDGIPQLPEKLTIDTTNAVLFFENSSGSSVQSMISKADSLYLPCLIESMIYFIDSTIDRMMSGNQAELTSLFAQKTFEKYLICHAKGVPFEGHLTSFREDVACPDGARKHKAYSLLAALVANGKDMLMKDLLDDEEKGRE